MGGKENRNKNENNDLEIKNVALRIYTPFFTKQLAGQHYRNSFL